jgi:hypothetical protein
MAPISLSRFRTGYAKTAVATLATISKTSSAAAIPTLVVGSSPAAISPGSSRMLAYPMK